MTSRNLLAVCFAALLVSSCSTVTNTSQTAAVDTQLYNLTVADMNVAAKKDSVTLDWAWNPLSTVSLSAQKESATHALLEKSDADVLIEPEYIVHRRGLFRGGSVTVTGYPASYSNFRAMTSEDAQNIATISGNMGGTVLVNPMLETTAEKVIKKRPVSPRLEQQHTNRQFINMLGGINIDINSDIDEAGFHFGLMYGSYGKNWGWYGKLAINSANLYDRFKLYDDGYYTLESSRKWTPTVTVGAIRTIGSHFNAFFGAGAGGYFSENDSFKEEVKFSIPVELGFMWNCKSFNLMLGATYATPVGGTGSGNIDPFVGFGYSF